MEKTVKIQTRRCTVCGETSTIEVIAQQYVDWKNGMLAQRAFPDMSVELRETLISGTHSSCWDSLMEEMD